MHVKTHSLMGKDGGLFTGGIVVNIRFDINDLELFVHLIKSTNQNNLLIRCNDNYYYNYYLDNYIYYYNYNYNYKFHYYLAG